MKPDHVDIWSKGEVIQFLFELLKRGKIKDCDYLRIKKGYANAFYPKCDQDLASRERAHNVTTNVTGYGAPSSYSWPVCPQDCPVYLKSDDFFHSLNGMKKRTMSNPFPTQYSEPKERTSKPENENLKNEIGEPAPLIKRIAWLLNRENWQKHWKAILLAFVVMIVIGIFTLAKMTDFFTSNPLNSKSSLPPPVSHFPFDLQIQRAKERIKYLSEEYLQTDLMSLTEVIGPFGDNVLDSPQFYEWNKVMDELEKEGLIKILKKTENNIEFKVIGSQGLTGTGNIQTLHVPFDVTLYFYPSGWMGDIGNIKLDTTFRENRRPDDTDGVCIRVNYLPGPIGWAGIFWQYPDSNWGDHPGSRIEGVKRLVLWASGANGGEVVEFKAGGIRDSKKRYQDSFEVSLGRVTLTKNWKKYEINLSNQDLSNVIGAFAWVATGGANPQGLTFYLDGIRYE